MKGKVNHRRSTGPMVGSLLIWHSLVPRIHKLLRFLPETRCEVSYMFLSWQRKVYFVETLTQHQLWTCVSMNLSYSQGKNSCFWNLDLNFYLSSLSWFESHFPKPLKWSNKSQVNICTAKINPRLLNCALSRQWHHDGSESEWSPDRYRSIGSGRRFRRWDLFQKFFRFQGNDFHTFFLICYVFRFLHLLDDVHFF